MLIRVYCLNKITDNTYIWRIICNFVKTINS